MARKRLTEASVRALKPDPDRRRLEYFDTDLSGFSVRVHPSGRKTFNVYYRNEWGQQRRPRVGVYGAVTLDQARKTAIEWLSEVAGGGDPSKRMREKRSASTVDQLFERYMAEHALPNKKAVSADGDRRNYLQHAAPVIGKMKAGAVELEDIQRLHRKIGGVLDRTHNRKKISLHDETPADKYCVCTSLADGLCGSPDLFGSNRIGIYQNEIRRSSPS